MVAQASLDSYIRADPGIRGGKPRIDGTRITVSDVVLWHLHMGMPFEQIAGDYRLSLSAVHAAMAYYYDHREAVDKRMGEEDARAKEFEKQSVPLPALKKSDSTDG
jgi:uncharacterized protein (DUF433 family)